MKLTIGKLTAKEMEGIWSLDFMHILGLRGLTSWEAMLDNGNEIISGMGKTKQLALNALEKKLSANTGGNLKKGNEV